MDLQLIIKSIMGLVVLLGLLIFLLFYMFPEEDTKIKKKKVVVKNTNTPDTSFVSLKKVIKNKKSTAEELTKALDLIIKHHGIITKKTAGRSHADFDIYMDVLFSLCRHPNANKNVIINFDRSLANKNPDYKSDINDAITKGLESRRVS